MENCGREDSLQNEKHCFPTVFYIWKWLFICRGVHWTPASNDTNFMINIIQMSQNDCCIVAVNTVRRYNLSVTMVCSMNKNNIRNGQGKSKRRIVRFKSKICEIKNISFEIQILPICTICSRFCAETQLFSGYRSDYRLIFALAMFNLDKNDGYVK